MPEKKTNQSIDALDACLRKVEEADAELMLLNERLSQTERDWEDIFDTLTDMITIHDADYNIIYANKAAEKILDLPVLNIKKAKCYKYYHGTEAPPAGCPSCQCLKTGKPAAFELYEPHLKRHVEIRAIPRFDTSRRQIGLIHIVRDITERKFTEEELERYRHGLEEMVDARTAELREANEQLQEALQNIRTLSGLVPICAWCKKIRNDKGYWDHLEKFIEAHSEARFTHGICPECRKQVETED